MPGQTPDGWPHGDVAWPAGGAGATLSPADQRLTVALLDFGQVMLGAAAAAHLVGAPVGADAALTIGAAAASVAVLFRFALQHDAAQAHVRGTGAVTAAAAVMLAIVAVMSAGLLLGSFEEVTLEWIMFWSLQGMACSALLRIAIPSLRGIQPAGAMPVALVGAHPDTDKLAARIVGQVNPRWRIVASLRDDLDGDVERLRDLVDRGRVGTVLLVLPLAEGARIDAVQDKLMDLPSRICLVADSAFAQDRADGLDPLPLIELQPAPLSGRRLALKRAMDLAVLGLLVPFIAPVLLGCAMAVRASSPGPILFSQLRLGRSGRLTKVYKFRTMYMDQGDATGARRTEARDPRVTPVGRILRRTSLDELPQLWNVLTGGMSLVGPRPHAPHMQVEGTLYIDAVRVYRRRHRITPGITGWAQVNGSRGAVDTLAKARRRVDLDLWYLENWSPILDLQIILRTALGGFVSPRAD